jgi:hypothetical protein
MWNSGPGLGARAAETIARERGALACIVNSGVQRVDAHRFYEKQGFTARGKAFYKALASS